MVHADAEIYMRRCIELAELGAGHVAPNPMVGAVLVHGKQIIGEGYHREYGGPHAEVNCLASVTPERSALIAESTLYVSLEPCAHHGKTPPCADLILEHGIRHVVVGCRDPFPEVNGKGIEKLRARGVHVDLGILEDECKWLNRRFFTFHTLHRPYIILKWAETADAKIAALGKQRLFITGSITNRLVHKWRSEESAILVGTKTAEIDDPQLNNRLWSGRSPVRLVVDLDLRLLAELHLFDRTVPTIVFNTRVHRDDNLVSYYQVTTDTNLVHQILNALYQLKILSVLVEGGAQLLQSFIDDGAWDEARIITHPELKAPGGLASPVLSDHLLNTKETVGGASVQVFVRK